MDDKRLIDWETLCAHCRYASNDVDSECDHPAAKKHLIDNKPKLSPLAAVEICPIWASLEDAGEDTRRIDWIDQNMDCDLAGPGLHISSVEISENETLRQALDRAAKEARK